MYQVQEQSVLGLIQGGNNELQDFKMLSFTRHCIPISEYIDNINNEFEMLFKEI